MKHRKFKVIILSLLWFLAQSRAFLPGAWALDISRLVASVDADRAVRYESFRNFKIKGVCGDVRLALAAESGANTIRTYTPPSRAQLDYYERLGFRVIAGIWMPHQGANPGQPGHWNYDYKISGDDQVKGFAKELERIGDHPAILMWCLGNEVPLDPAYLETVNRMSQLLHQKFPRRLTSITIINVPKDGIELIKKYAPDLDVIGSNCYGQGAVNNASRRFEQDWGRGYYISELGPQGPWWGTQTAWGEYYEQAYDLKLEDLRKSFQIIDAAPRCLGSAVFLWGCWRQQKPTYFSAFLSLQNDNSPAVENELCTTPMAEEFCRYWSGKYPAHRGPVLVKITIDGLQANKDAVVQSGQPFRVRAAAKTFSAQDAKLNYRWWILDKGGQTVFGPIDSDQPVAELTAPAKSGKDYFVMGFVIAPHQRASGFTVPIAVLDSCMQPPKGSGIPNR